jgi:hydroxyethylthiazole kinase
MSSTERDAAGVIADGLASLRARRPLIHHLANFVTMHLVASTTRALGAAPVMAMDPDDAAAMVEHADVLVISLGTPTSQRIAAMFAAGRRAAARGIPIVLDPVGVGATPLRTALAERLFGELPITVVRANRGEAAALMGRPGAVRGVETRHGDALDGRALAEAVARQRRCVAAVSGPIDYVAGEARAVSVSNGHPWLDAATGAGCAVTAAVGAFCAVSDDYVLATAAGLACFGVAAEAAAQDARGPGTLMPGLLDALYHLTPDAVRRAAQVHDG